MNDTQRKVLNILAKAKKGLTIVDIMSLAAEKPLSKYDRCILMLRINNMVKDGYLSFNNGTDFHFITSRGREELKRNPVEKKQLRKKKAKKSAIHKFTLREKKVMAFIGKEGASSSKAIAAGTDIKYSSINHPITTLIKKRILQTKNERENGACYNYEIINEADVKQILEGKTMMEDETKDDTQQEDETLEDTGIIIPQFLKKENADLLGVIVGAEVTHDDIKRDDMPPAKVADINTGREVKTGKQFRIFDTVKEKEYPDSFLADRSDEVTIKTQIGMMDYFECTGEPEVVEYFMQKYLKVLEALTP